MRKNGFPRSGIKHERHCEICGKSFWIHPFGLKNKKNGRFCSMKCMTVWRSKEWTGENNPNFRNAMIDRTCQYCKKQFRASKKQILSKHKGKESCKFCSKTCYNLFMLKPGSTRTRGGGWNSQKKQSRKRDRYQCQICGVTKTRMDEGLPVHHIVPFRLFGYVPGKNNNHLIANQLDNLITLCNKHHIGYCEGKPPEFFREFISEERYLAVKELEKFVYALTVQ